MDFCDDLTLSQKATLKILTVFWNQERTQDFMEPILCNKDKEFCSNWELVEKRIAEKVVTLPLPQFLKKKLKCLIKPIGLRVLRWRQYHNCVSELDVIPCRLFWVSRGYMKKERIEELIQEERTDIARCFELACIYCFSCCNGTLWQQSLDNSEQEPKAESLESLVVERSILSFWSRHLKNHVPKLYSHAGSKGKKMVITPVQCAFECATLCGNKGAAEHFLKRMSVEERNQILCGVAQYLLEIGNNPLSKYHRNSRLFFPEFFNDMFCFLLSKMNEEEHVKVLAHYPSLKCLLHWPWQPYFIAAIDCVWGSLHEEEYCFTLRAIIMKIRLGFKDYNYPELFECLWRKSPANYKMRVIEFDPNLIFLDLFYNRETSRVSLILKEVIDSEKEEYISSFMGKKICCTLAENNLWDLLEFFLRKCLLSECAMLKFKKDFVWYSTECAPVPWQLDKNTMDRFIQLLEKLMHSNDEI